MGGQSETIEAQPQAGEQSLSRRGLDLDRTYLVLAVLVVVGLGLSQTIDPSDYWWHLASAREILAAGSVPSTDVFSWTMAGEPFFTQPWLGQLHLYWPHVLGGPPVALLVHAVVLATAYGGLLAWLTRITERPRLCAVVVLLFTVPLSTMNWNLRPQTLALPLLVVFVVILDAVRRGADRRWLWLLPAVMLLWVNVHGSFPLGLGLAGLVLAGEAWRSRARLPGAMSRQGLLHLAAVVVACTAATLANPRGFGVVGYVIELLTSTSVGPLVTEWRSPVVTELGGLFFFVGTLAVVGALLRAPQRPSATDLLVVTAFWLIALTGIRHVLWFAVVATPLLATSLAEAFSARQKRADVPALNAALVVVVGLGVVVASPWVRPHVLDSPQGQLLAPNTPVEAAAVLDELEDAPERMFNDIAMGSYLTWAAPDVPVFMDPRFELYPLEQWLDYRDFGAGVRVDDILESYAFDALLLDRVAQAPLIDVLEELRWETVHEDERAVLLRAR